MVTRRCPSSSPEDRHAIRLASALARHNDNVRALQGRVDAFLSRGGMEGRDDQVAELLETLSLEELITQQPPAPDHPWDCRCRNAEVPPLEVLLGTWKSSNRPRHAVMGLLEGLGSLTWERNRIVGVHRCLPADEDARPMEGCRPFVLAVDLGAGDPTLLQAARIAAESDAQRRLVTCVIDGDGERGFSLASEIASNLATHCLEQEEIGVLLACRPDPGSMDSRCLAWIIQHGSALPLAR